ncbi:beta-N-acetylhexosaminidase [Wenyingzhuangia sp. 2_MG-2023]|uniref:beta-N-acetylhexosaminidase n=1 Tax=Wenyingzhuangia sp. 2_MG-2023 TaxID=3062639 RepID=UPI0026E173B0|nr:beta-N-acetylhexosaminidase [Wenyingzhuangia sp. 2_MG-2023]MDO6738692.1 beta-N-acetylhexosaminidase [Wenyingzhuangia sp. 2_MG-2023]
MKLINIICLFVGFFTNIVQASPAIQIIPQPSKIVLGTSEITLKKNVKIIANQEVMSEATYLAEFLEKGFRKKIKIVAKGKGIHLEIVETLKNELGEEGYMLSVGKDQIVIKAATTAGLFYGIQSFKQLLPVDFGFVKINQKIKISELEIMDKPRFPWRAFMLDESRHFKGATVVKNLLDQMALLKMNTFHWHLTDDQGWRIEIKKYPKLTEIGSKRKNTQLSRKSEERTGVPHEGFYTQEEIKEIISYAKKRHISVVPEIEMPGHAMAAIAAYPWLGSLGTTTEVPEVFGKMDDSFNIANPKVVRFLKDILDEVLVLFPSQVVHIGGDEVNFKPWEDSESVQSFMESKGLKSPVDLQIYFTNQISNYIDNAGKRMMGWNEIMGGDVHGERKEEAPKSEQKLAKSAIVHFWKGNLDLINKAVQEGYDVVNSNHWDTYLDYTYKRTPLSKSYAFDPIPEGLDKKYQSHILGTGTQMWSEWIPTVPSMEKQIFPRLAAYAEVGWTDIENKNFERFEQSLKKIKERWTLLGIHFYELEN